MRQLSRFSNHLTLRKTESEVKQERPLTQRFKSGNYSCSGCNKLKAMNERRLKAKQGPGLFEIRQGKKELFPG